MGNSELNHPEQFEANIKPFTAEEFQLLISEYKDDWRSSDFYKNSDGRIDEGKYHEFYNVEMRALIESLIKESERFKHVFQTSNGSSYFVLNSGESQRIKCSDNKFDSRSIQPLLNDLFFVSDAEFERLIKLVKGSYLRYDALLGIPIEEVDFAVGAHPIELNMHHAPSPFDILLERSGNIMFLNAKKHEWDPPGLQGQISNGVHIGNRVVKIIK